MHIVLKYDSFIVITDKLARVIIISVQTSDLSYPSLLSLDLTLVGYLTVQSIIRYKKGLEGEGERERERERESVVMHRPGLVCVRAACTHPSQRPHTAGLPVPKKRKYYT